MNTRFESTKDLEYKEVPLRFEAGTQNIAGVLGLKAAILYLENIGLDKIHEHEITLRKYLVEKLMKIKNITVYNQNSEAGIVIFNIDKIFAEDTSR